MDPLNPTEIVKPAGSPKTSHRPGLRFRKLDLHLHTPASRCFGDKSVTAEMIVAEAIQKGLAGIAVTDHNSAAWVDLVKAAAEHSDIVIFPGVEITCMGGTSGIHIIALFDPSCGRVPRSQLCGDIRQRTAKVGGTNKVHSFHLPVWVPS
jgi:predicted metal-dependent phosphoesterase TrpH